METHYHQCPYCRTVYECNEGCFSSRINNKICSRCKRIWEKERMDVVKQRGADWRDDMLW